MSIPWLLTNLAAACLLPPFNGLLLAGLGLLLMGSRPRLGRWLAWSGVLLLGALSLGVVANALLAPLEARYPALPVQGLRKLPVEAIVVLGAGRYREGQEFDGGDDVAGPALERLRYGALLARASGKPLLVSGGKPDGGSDSEARAMARSLVRDFGVTVRWQEEASDNTRENARHTAELLRRQGVGRIALVTHAWHMPRAVAAFRDSGLEVLPAPMGYLGGRSRSALDYVPSEEAMRQSRWALHEWIGQAWYALPKFGQDQ